MKMTRSRSVDLAAPRRRLKTTPSVSLWRPEIVLAEPTARPEAIQTQLGATRSLLAGLDGARETLSAVAADARTRAAGAASTRERVSATIAAYRAEAAMDDVLTGAWRRVSALMEERGLR